jgi:hypothetical protein
MREGSYSEIIHEVENYNIEDIALKCLFKCGGRIDGNMDTIGSIPENGILEVLLTEDEKVIHYAVTYPDKYIEIKIIK